MITVSYNIKPKPDIAIARPYLVEKTSRFETVVDAKRFIDNLRRGGNKHYTIVGKPVIN